MRIPQVGNNLNPMVDKPVPASQQIWQPALLFLMLGLLLKILSMSFAAVHQDSGYYLNIGSNFIERGELTPYMWRLGADTNIIAGSGTGYGVLLLNYWFKVFGLSLLSGYIFMYLAGLLSLVVLYFLARDWWGGQAPDPSSGDGGADPGFHRNLLHPVRRCCNSGLFTDPVAAPSCRTFRAKVDALWGRPVVLGWLLRYIFLAALYIGSDQFHLTRRKRLSTIPKGVNSARSRGGCWFLPVGSGWNRPSIGSCPAPSSCRFSHFA